MYNLWLGFVYTMELIILYILRVYIICIIHFIDI